MKIQVSLVKGIFFRLWLIIFTVSLSLSVSANNNPDRITIGEFSSQSSGQQLTAGWQPLTFKKIPAHTRYELVRDGSTTVVKASSDAAASGLVRKISIDLKSYPFIHWRWKIDHLIGKSDARHKDGDDYPARIYITFAYQPDRVGTYKKLKYALGRKLFGEIPIAAINYIWEPHLPAGTVIDNPFTSFARMIVVQSGNSGVGQWLDEKRNVYQDYVRAFAEEPPPVNSVAIMTDTDNTGEQATAYYGDIYFTAQDPDTPVSDEDNATN